MIVFCAVGLGFHGALVLLRVFGFGLTCLVLLCWRECACGVICFVELL